MKNNVLFLAALLFSQFVSIKSASAEAVGTDLCNVDGVPVVFERTNNGGTTQFVVDGLAVLDEDGSLFYHFNPFYGIGGRVILRTTTSERTLISWLNDFSSTVPHGLANHGRLLIECSIH